MQFSDTTNKNGILQEIDFWILGSSGTASSDYSTADKTRNVNRWLDRVNSLIMQADHRWEWDDTNHTDLPIATTTLVNNQQDYGLNTSHLKIIRVEIKNNAGNYNLILPISQEDIKNQALTEFQETAGMPRYYDKIGNSIFLYPKPSSSQVTLVAGLKVYFKRNVDYFTASDTTQGPGFAPQFHRTLSVGAALDYCIANGLIGRILLLEREIQKLESGILAFYATRDEDDKPRIGLRKENYLVAGSAYNDILETLDIRFNDPN